MYPTNSWTNTDIAVSGIFQKSAVHMDNDQTDD